MLKIRSVLAFPSAYRLFANMVFGNGLRTYVREYIKPASGMKVLDIGCGPADIIAELPDVDYHGFDLNPSYIAAARRRYGNRGTFHVEDVAAATVRQLAEYDLVLATGLLHHLDNEDALRLLKIASDALRAGGRLITLDGCWVAGQSRLARWLLKKDRGEYVRSPQEYVGLARLRFGDIESHIRHDLLRIPYTHHIMICTKGLAAELDRG